MFFKQTVLFNEQTVFPLFSYFRTMKYSWTFNISIVIILGLFALLALFVFDIFVFSFSFSLTPKYISLFRFKCKNFSGFQTTRTNLLLTLSVLRACVCECVAYARNTLSLVARFSAECFPNVASVNFNISSYIY